MASKATQTATKEFTNVTCGFCSLLCDDLVVRQHPTKLEVDAKGCLKAIAGYERPWADTTPQIGGQPATLEQAVKRATEIIRQAKHPLYGGLATDVDGFRAVMQLTEKTRGTLDHVAGDVMMRNVRAVQSKGWIMTTMGEIKNRADTIVFIGTDVHKEFPRFYERLVWNKETLFGMDPKKRQIVFIGKGLDPSPGRSPDGHEALHVPCEFNQIGEVMGALRALFAGRKLQSARIAGIKVNDLMALLDVLNAAKYGAVVWDAGKFTFPHGDLTVQTICDLVKDLNQSTRYAGFNLAGSDGGLSAQSVCAWQSGFALKTSYENGYPTYDPLRYTTARLVAGNEVDAMLWISTFTAGRTPPPANIPTIVLMEPGVTLPRTPEVYIPVGTPGVDSGGRLVRCDNVVTVPLKQVREVGLPSVTTVINSIMQAL